MPINISYSSTRDDPTPLVATFSNTLVLDLSQTTNPVSYSPHAIQRNMYLTLRQLICVRSPGVVHLIFMVISIRPATIYTITILGHRGDSFWR